MTDAASPSLPGRPFGTIFAGVGGQGTLTLAQVLVETARRSGYNVLQSEIHGMSQRGGMVNAHVSFSRQPVTSPVVGEGTGDLLIAVEPLEALRYVPFLGRDASLVVSRETLAGIDGYPDPDELYRALESIPGTRLIDTARHRKELKFPQAGGTVLLGAASALLPFDVGTWEEVLRDRFAAKGEKVIDKNLAAFAAGREEMGAKSEA